MGDILDIKSLVHNDSSITNKEFHAHNPYTSSFGHNDEIRIAIQNQDLILDVHNSYLYIEARISRIAGAGANAVNPNLTANFGAFLFSEVRFELNSVQIDQTKGLPWSMLLKGYASMTPQEARFQRVSSWGAEGAAAPATFSIAIPLKNVLGWAEDYSKALINSRCELILIRSRSDTNCFTGAEDIVTISIDKIQWYVQHLTLSDTAKLKMLRHIESRQPIEMAFRSWSMHEYPTMPTTNKTIWQIKTSSRMESPRFIIVGFQTNRNNVIANSASIFDNVGITDLRVHLNSDIYPYEALKTNFDQVRFANLYYAYCKFQESYYQRPHPAPYLSFEDFFANPLFVIDCSHQNESIKNSAVDISLEITCVAQMPARTTAYCLIINEAKVSYSPYTGIVTKHV